MDNRIKNHELPIKIAYSMFFLFFAATSNLWASSPTYDLSTTARLDWSPKISYVATSLPNLNTVVFDVLSQTISGKTAKITARNEKPLVWASFASIKKSWSSELHSVAAVSNSKLWKDLGCKSIGQGRFSCIRTGITPDGSTVVENIFWNRNLDHILLRTEAHDSLTKTMELAQQVKISFMESAHR